MRLQECAEAPGAPGVLDNPEAIVNYLNSQLPGSIAYRPDTENLICVYLTTRRKPITWAIVLAHNHPSGDPTPSEADVKVTRELIRGGQLLKIDVLDHVILGTATPERPKAWASLRELGYFYT